jgi:hypothetical protein
MPRPLHRYGPSVTARDIVDGGQQITTPAAARSFVTALAREVTGTSGRK